MPLKREFKCTGCGRCCTGDPREYEVRATRAEQARMAEYLGLSLETFRARYVIGRGLSMAKGRCVFLRRDRRCAVYPVRPRQCASYPWWPELRTDKAWIAEARECEGIRLPPAVRVPVPSPPGRARRTRATRRSGR